MSARCSASSPCTSSRDRSSTSIYTCRLSTFGFRPGNAVEYAEAGARNRNEYRTAWTAAHHGEMTETVLRLSTRQGRWVVTATVLGSSLALLDGTVVNIALPHIGEDLGSDVAGMQWVLSGYTLALASLILLGGALGD